MAPTSPVKRVTRARAAKSSTTDMEEPPKKALAAKAAGVRKAKATTKTEDTTTTPAEKPTKKPSTKAVSSTATIATAPRRRVKVTPLVVPAVENMENAPEEAAVSGKPTKARKATSKAESTSETEAAPKSRTRKATSNVQVDEVKPEPKTRGRPKKAVENPEPAVSGKPVRQTRKRVESHVESAESTAASTAEATTIPRKKVTFQDLPDDDKENQPIPTKRGAGKKESAVATGLRARPVRKPVATTTRKRAVVGKTESQAPRALTPKKITQVARSSTPADSDEDELSGGKTPIRDLSQSPKRNELSVRSPSPVKKLDFAQTLNATSPLKTSIQSPPRRIPQSPFKNSLKESPKRGEGIPVFPTLTATLGVSATGAINSQADAALQQSPKRGIIDNSIFSRSTMKLQKSPAKPFLSQSPVRRLFSPLKQSVRTETLAQENAEVTETAVSSYFRSSQSPIRSAKIHRMSDEELAFEKAQGIDFDESVINIRSPIKISKLTSAFVEEAEEAPVMVVETLEETTTTPATPRGPWSKAEEAEFAPVDAEDNQLEEAEVLEDGDPVTAKEDASLPVTANAASYLLNTYALRAEDESSEDELQADQTPQRPLFGGRPSLSNKTTRTRLSSGLADGAASNLGFTPLASQLCGWFASSPEKQAEPVAQHQGDMFSPLAMQHVPGEVQVSRQSTPVKEQSVGARQSVGLRKSIAPRSSLATSITASPTASSYFADEMAAIDLEEQVETRESIGIVASHIEEGTVQQAQLGDTFAQEIHDTASASEDTVDDIVQQKDYLDEALSATGVLEEPVMTDTAMLDFVNIAQEAEELALGAEESPRSSTSSEYGDENTVIVTRQEEVPVIDLSASETPLASEVIQPEVKVQAEDVQDSNEDETDFNTPIRPDLSQPRFVNTIVSKVPLRPEGHLSPIKNPKKRSRSLSAGPGSAKKPLLDAGAFSIPKSNTVITLSPERQAPSPARSTAASTPGQVSFAVSDFGDSTLDGIEILDDSDDEADDSILSKIPSSIKSSKIRSTVATPARTPLKAVGGGVLHGAVVYVDVHTTEGADASGIFVDLLTQMGAKCVREWKWNLRASLAADDVENMATPAKIGITHVVYKDGGKRTLEKVRDTKGEVCCVGVGWVLDCERENKWLDESAYTVDPAILPRGGSRRRKSMEPRALINANGSLSAARSRSISAEMTKEMRDELINTPVRRPLSPLANTAGVTNVEDEDDMGSPEADVEAQAATPTGFVKYDPSISMSPKTPYLMKEGAKFIQQSAPPKQIQQGLFPSNGKIEDQPDENTRNKLDAARRKTMNWQPRVASPLGK